MESSPLRHARGHAIHRFPRTRPELLRTFRSTRTDAARVVAASGCWISHSDSWLAEGGAHVDEFEAQRFGTPGPRVLRRAFK